MYASGMDRVQYYFCGSSPPGLHHCHYCGALDDYLQPCWQCSHSGFCTIPDNDDYSTSMLRDTYSDSDSEEESSDNGVPYWAEADDDDDNANSPPSEFLNIV